MKRLIIILLFQLLLTSISSQERRPIDNAHPLWMMHIDVWNSADPQKIIDLIPEDIRPYVCMNLSLSSSYDTTNDMYKMPRNAVRTYKSWASICQLNGLWFTCQPASGGHTHIQDDDLETFEYFFKTYPNFLGWNYAEQFWGFDEPGDKSSSGRESRIALFARLVEMSHNYGGFLTVSYCGNIWSHNLNPIAMLKSNSDLMKACEDYPEAILWLYKYTTSACFYNNESVSWGPFVSGLAKNYGVRYDVCGWNGALDVLLGSGHGLTYPGAAGIGTVMEQTCVNGASVWDGPELIWSEDFQNLSTTNVNGYTRRQWGTFQNFDNIWVDMFRKIIDGTMYIPSREEVVAKTKIAVANDVEYGSSEDMYAVWSDLYDGVYKQNDPLNSGTGQWMENMTYFKMTGRYGAIPLVTGFYDESSQNIPSKIKKSQYSSLWKNEDEKKSAFDALYPEVSTGDLYVNRYGNQLVTYTPYSYLNGKSSASASIPLQYNTCETLELTYGKLSSGIIREYSDHINFYLNNFRNDTTTVEKDVIKIKGVNSQPIYTLSTRGINNSNIVEDYDSATDTYTLTVSHLGPVDLTVNCSGKAERSDIMVLPSVQLSTPKQPVASKLPIIIEAENMDYKDVEKVVLTNSSYWAPDYEEFAGLGFVEMGSNTAASLRYQLNLTEGGDYKIAVRYCNTDHSGDICVWVNGEENEALLEYSEKNDWKKASFNASLRAGVNYIIINNDGGTAATIDQLILSPEGTSKEKFLVNIRSVQHGVVTSDFDEAAEGEVVTLTAVPEEGYHLKELRVVNSVYYTMSKTIKIDASGKISFVMPDDNVTILPVFSDESASYKLDLTDALSGTIPEGWRCEQENGEMHEYPNSYSSGARIFVGFSGYQGKGLYWRNVSAEYGVQEDYPLTLDASDYTLSFSMAAWKGTPDFKVSIINAETDECLVESEILSASPNADGSLMADLSEASTVEIPFTVTESGNFILSFTDETAVDGSHHEFLLLSCSIIPKDTSSVVGNVSVAPLLPEGIYSPTGIRLQTLQKGINIVVDSDGKTHKLLN